MILYGIIKGEAAYKLVKYSEPDGKGFIGELQTNHATGSSLIQLKKQDDFDSYRTALRNKHCSFDEYTAELKRLENAKTIEQR